MKRNISYSLIALLFLVTAPMAHAISMPITVDQIIWQPDSGFDGTDLSATVVFSDIDTGDGTIDPDSFLITLSNTSGILGPDDFSSVLLTGIGFTLPSLYSGCIVGGEIIGLASDGADLSGTWGYDNYPLHSGPFLNVTTASLTTVISTMDSSTQPDSGLPGGDQFQGPNYGILDTNEMTVGGLPYILDSALITVNLSVSVDDWADFFSEIESISNTVVVSFGSPTAVVPEPSTILFFSSGLLGLAAFRRKFRKK